MNGLLSGLASSQGSQGNDCDHDHNKKCCNNNNGIFGGNGIILIIVLLFLCGGLGQGQQNCGTVCGCEKKHCKELCACGSSSSGCGGIGGLGGLGSGYGSWWIIILLLLCFCGGNQNKKCDCY
jgi:hypothetical protein